MGWSKLMDGFHDHPKFDRIGDDPDVVLMAAGLQAFAQSYVSTHATDGVIPKARVRLLSRNASRCDAIVTSLVTAGFWIENDDHFLLKGYLEYNHSKKQREREKKLTTKRQRNLRERKKLDKPGGSRPPQESKPSRSRHAVTNASRNAAVTASDTDTDADTDLKDPPISPPAGDALELGSKLPPGAVQRVFEYHAEKTGHGGRLTPEKRKRITARLREGFSVEDLCTAVDGLLLDEWHVDKGNTTVTCTFRNAEKVEKFVALARSGGAPEKQRSQLEKLQETLAAAIREKRWDDYERIKRQVDELKARTSHPDAHRPAALGTVEPRRTADVGIPHGGGRVGIP